VIGLLLALIGSPWVYAAVAALALAAVPAARWRHEAAWILIAAAVALAASAGIYREGAAACEQRVREVRIAVDAIDKELKAQYRDKLADERRGIDARIKEYVATLPNDCRARRGDVDRINGILRRAR
jgi:hypothetical protein